MKIFFVVIFTLMCLIFCMETHARFIVETIYFKPSDIGNHRMDKIKEMVEGAQILYEMEMDRNGFGKKTFRLERDANRDIIIHRVNGRHGWQHYTFNTWEKIQPELPDRFNPDTPPWDKQDRVRLIIVGGLEATNGVSWGVGWPYQSNRYGGGVLIATNSGHFTEGLIFHELGHAFGLYHKPEGKDPEALEHYEARWLDKHYQFNNRANNFTLPKVEWQNPKLTVLKPDNIKLEVVANSDIGLHQAEVFRKDDIHVIDWDYLNGEKRGVITLEANRRNWDSEIVLKVMDTSGNYVMIDMTLDIPDVIAGEVPADMDTITYSQDLSNVNVLMYIGAVSWMSLDDANRQSQITKQLLSSKGIRAEIVQTEDSIRDWMLQTTSDGNVDVLILYGTLPISIYPPFNSQPDGSVAENWIESTDGNTILNHGDYFGFWAGGNQEELGGRNGVQALQAIMDIPHITMWDFGLENNTPMRVTQDGKEVTPSLTNFKSDRAFHLDELTGNWFAEKVLASDTGTSQATRADPVIVRDGNRGRIGIVYQTFNEVNPKGKVVAELIANFLLENNDKISLPPIEPIIDNDIGGTSEKVSLLPISVQSPNIGQLLELSLKIAKGKNVAGYQATMSFDTTALRYVGSSNGNYLPTETYVLPPVLTGNTLTLAATSLSGKSQGDGTLATLTFEVVAVKASTVSLSDVLLTNGSGGSSIPQTENAEITEPTHTTQKLADVNKDGVVNIIDLALVASNFGKNGENAADVNSDGIVNIVDLTLVAAAFGGTNSAPGTWHPDLTGVLARSEIKQWLHHARQLNRRDPAFQRGLLILEQLLASLPPKETALLPNYPNPFNPETWIPYQLAKDAEVTLTIYATNGYIVRRLALGHQPPGLYENRSRAAYWDGRNEFGELVASGVYFYTFTAGDFAATQRMLILK